MIKSTKIAVLGATSHIGKNLICKFLHDSSVTLFLFGRSYQKIADFVSTFGDVKTVNIIDDYDCINNFDYDVIINCIVLSPTDNSDYINFFLLAEKVDGWVFDYLYKVNPDALYINFSSGTVYGVHMQAHEKNSKLSLPVNNINHSDYCRIVKINSEAKHRAATNLRIVDIRIYGFFSRFIDIERDYFMSAVLKSLLHNEVLQTSPSDMCRDYIDPDDLINLIKCIMKEKNINTALDAYSKKEVLKFEILECFKVEFGLKYQISSSDFHTKHGKNDIYFSKFHLAQKFGYIPKYTALESLVKEVRQALK